MKRVRGAEPAVATAAAPAPGDGPDEGTQAADTHLAQWLVGSQLVPETEARASLGFAKDKGLRLGRVLVDRGHLTESGLATALAQYYSLQLVDLGAVTPAPEALALLTEPTARSLEAMPVALGDDNILYVAVADLSEAVMQRVAEATGRSIVPVVTTRQDILRAIGNSYSALTDIGSQLRAFEVADSVRKDSTRLESMTINDDAPVVQVVQLMITQGLRDRASDIHIEPTLDRVRVRFRVDGALQEVLSLPESIGPAVVSRVKILADMNIVERRRAQDGQISMTIDGREVDIRVSTTSVVGGEKVVMRLLDKSRPLFQLAELGMPEDVESRFQALLRVPYGMVICAGPTGGGKTTTLYASLGQINSPERNIMTIEDPVEYTFPTINQIQINEQAGITFAGGLRSILRQDPDVILVGEVRDVDTARIAVQSALTGHLVLSSLHATDAVAALYRLLDMGIEPFLVASSVTAVMAQRLVRRTCMSCIELYQPSPEELHYLEWFGGTPPRDGFVRGAGCNFCGQTGFLERIGIYELISITDEVRELILEHASHDDLRKVCRSQGTRTLQEESVRLVQQGVTTLAEVMRSIYVAGM